MTLTLLIPAASKHSFLKRSGSRVILEGSDHSRRERAGGCRADPTGIL